MNVMTADDTRKLLNVLLDIGDIDVVRSSLEQDFGGCEGKRKCRLQDDESDEKRHSRVGVKTSGPCSLPDDQSRHNDSKIS